MQEKVDGSQISFRVDKNGEVEIRSKNAKIDPKNAGMFQKAVDYVLENKWRFIPNFTYRGEYLSSLRHNILKYDRVPKNNIILFDVDAEDGPITSPFVIQMLAEQINLESVPCLLWDAGKVQDMLDKTEKMLSAESILGGCTIEGIVIKNYSKQDEDGRPLMAKLVRPNFQEIKPVKINKAASIEGITNNLIESLATEMRFNKAIQHLKEKGELFGDKRDIGNIIKETNLDILLEETDTIKDFLFDALWKSVSRGIAKKVSERYILNSGGKEE